jgi:predicted lysophospholipase L1 biosynthesis ABC-type transport system permease subunit
MDVALQQIRNVMLSTHKGIEDFSFRTQEEWAENIATFVRNARLSGGLIAGISLLVGGIGIMNIMLASISGRIREIGIRKAVGAGTSDIFTQILVESLVLASSAALSGWAVPTPWFRQSAIFHPMGTRPSLPQRRWRWPLPPAPALGSSLGCSRVQSQPPAPDPSLALRVTA